MSLRSPLLLHDYRGNRLQTAPGSEPITLTELKSHLRISGSSEDTYLTDLITEARQEIEDATGIAFIDQTWKLTLDRWPAAREPWWDGVRQGHINILNDTGRWASVTLPRYPLSSITSVTVYDESSNSTAVTVANVFDVDTESLQGRITLQQGATWPVALRSSNAIEIVYVAGYGSAASDVPAPLKRAVRQMAAYMYEHRGDGCEPKDAYNHSGAARILNRYRAVEV